MDEGNDRLGRSRAPKVHGAAGTMEVEPYAFWPFYFLLYGADLLILPVNGREKFASELARQNFFRICESWRPALLGHGHSEASVDELIARAQDEVVNMKAHTYVGVGTLERKSVRVTNSFSFRQVPGKLGCEARRDSPGS